VRQPPGARRVSLYTKHKSETTSLQASAALYKSEATSLQASAALYKSEATSLQALRVRARRNPRPSRTSLIHPT
jgi:hypothetical protein